MVDGAHLDAKPSDALKVILGGDEPESLVQQDLIDFEVQIRTAKLPVNGEPLSYDDGTMAIARIILEIYEEWPMLRDMSDETLYLRNPAGEIDWKNPIALNRTFYEVVKQLRPEYYDDLFSGMTGFMWGWAINAARHTLGLGPVPNPAIVTVGISDETGGATIDELMDDIDRVIEGG